MVIIVVVVVVVYNLHSAPAGHFAGPGADFLAKLRKKLCVNDACLLTVILKLDERENAKFGSDFSASRHGYTQTKRIGRRLQKHVHVVALKRFLAFKAL